MGPGWEGSKAGAKSGVYTAAASHCRREDETPVGFWGAERRGYIWTGLRYFELLVLEVTGQLVAGAWAPGRWQAGKCWVDAR